MVPHRPTAKSSNRSDTSATEANAAMDYWRGWDESNGKGEGNSEPATSLNSFGQPDDSSAILPKLAATRSSGWENPPRIEQKLQQGEKNLHAAGDSQKIADYWQFVYSE